MMYDYVCPICGAYLDPAEVCDCEKENAPADCGDRQGLSNTTGAEAPR